MIVVGRLAALLVLVLLALRPLPSSAQSWPRDVTGVPAPPCTYLSQTGALTTCSEADPLPMAPAAGLRTTDATAWGKEWLVAVNSPVTTKDVALWEGDGTVTRLNASGSAAATVSRSLDQGRSYVTTATTVTALGFPRSFLKVSGVYVLVKETLGGVGNNTIVRSTNLLNWTNTTGLPAGTTSGGMVAAQGTTILAAIAVPGGSGTRLCRSIDLAVSFTCQDLGTGVVSPGLNITSPAASTWLVIDSQIGVARTVYRSTDDGVTWTAVATLAVDAASTQGEGLTCLSATICLAAAAGRIYRSTDAGLTWTQVNILPAVNKSLYGFLNFGQGIVQALGRPGSSPADPNTGQRTIDFGVSWAPSTIVTDGTSSCVVGTFEGYSTAAAFNGRAIASCQFNSAGIADSEMIVSPVSGAPRFDRSGAQLMLWSDGATERGSIDRPVQIGAGQGPTLFNSQQTGAANTAVSVTIAAAANQRAHIYRIEASCSAGTSQLTVTDGGTTVWSTPTGEVSTPRFREAFTPAALTGSTNSAVVITLGACGAGNAGTLIVHADRY